MRGTLFMKTLLAFFGWLATILSVFGGGCVMPPPPFDGDKKR